MALFVVFEGVDGSGKSTQSRALMRRLTESGYSATLLREPGGTPTGEYIRQLLKGEDKITPLAELFLFSAARASLVDLVIRPKLERGEITICDRYTYSTIAYQGYGRGLDMDTILQLNAVATGGLVPDIVALLDLAPEEGFSRKRGTQLDRIEREQKDFHQRVREGYLDMARQDPERWLVLDSVQPPEALSEQVWRRVERML